MCTAVISSIPRTGVSGTRKPCWKDRSIPSAPFAALKRRTQLLRTDRAAKTDTPVARRRVWVRRNGGFHASGLDSPRATVFAASYEVRLSLLSTGRFLAIFPSSVLRFPPKRPEIKVLPAELPIHRPPNG